MQSLPSSDMVLGLRNGLYSGNLVILAGQLAGASEAVASKFTESLLKPKE